MSRPAEREGGVEYVMAPSPPHEAEDNGCLIIRPKWPIGLFLVRLDHV
jgi:hypothetical protein